MKKVDNSNFLKQLSIDNRKSNTFSKSTVESPE